ncbi:hypothetical protein P3S68_002280 [Capsicum galapagoense]
MLKEGVPIVEIYVEGRCSYSGALDSSTNLELFELYIIDKLLYSGGTSYEIYCWIGVDYAIMGLNFLKKDYRNGDWLSSWWCISLFGPGILFDRLTPQGELLKNFRKHKHHVRLLKKLEDILLVKEIYKNNL